MSPNGLSKLQIRMRTSLRFLLPLIFTLGAAATPHASRPNVLFIAIDDLRNDLGALGISHAKTPHLDTFANSGRLFRHHYVQAPTCGASRCALWSGRRPHHPDHLDNHAILKTHASWSAPSLPALFRRNGYLTLGLGKLTHHPGGRTGKDWKEGPEEMPGAWDRSWVPLSPWQSPLAMMHGYANGVARQSGVSPAWEAHDGPDESYPDAWVVNEAIETLEHLAKRDTTQPWFLGVGFFKPHLPFAAPKRWFDLHSRGIPELSTAESSKPTWPSGWHSSGEFRNNYGHPPDKDPSKDAAYARQLRQAYAASVSYVDAQVGRLLESLQKLDLKQTIVIVWSDHGFLLGEHAIWGKHCLYEGALRSPLIIRTPNLPFPGKPAAAIVETIDIYPTLAELCGFQIPGDVDGVSLLPQLNDPDARTSKPAVSFWTDNQFAIRDDNWRLITQIRPDKAATRIELFNYTFDPFETRNLVSDHPEVVQSLLKHIKPFAHSVHSSATFNVDALRDDVRKEPDL
jgi:iduronate 2-sulfatase